MKIYDHEVHLLRVLLFEIISESSKNGKDKAHINLILNRASQYISVTKVKSIIELLCLTEEVISFGFGWYGLSAPINILESNISVGWSGSAPDETYRQAYCLGELDVELSLESWLGPPFSYNVTKGEAFLLFSESSIDIISSRPEVYWTDFLDHKGKENWVSLAEHDVLIPERALLKVNRGFFNEFVNCYDENTNIIDPLEAYELAAIKDYLRGKKFPYSYKFDGDYIAVTPKRYVPRAMKKLAFLLSIFVQINKSSIVYYFTTDSFQELKERSEGYTFFFKDKK